MDDAQSRATMVLMEAFGKMMIGLTETGALPIDFCRHISQAAANHLEPTGDGRYLEMMSQMWLQTAAMFERTNPPN